jgi:hypothetical protein
MNGDTNRDEPADEGPSEIRVPLVLTDAESTPILFVNHFMVQHQPNYFILTVGQFAPPALIGTPAEKRRRALEIPQISVRTVARLAFTREAAEELVTFLQVQIQEHDKSQGKEVPNATDD